MATNKLLTLGGLGAGATAAIAGPGATFAGGVSGPAPYKSSLFWGLTTDSKNLYQTFNLDCIDKTFPGLKLSKDVIKGEASGEVEDKDFSLESPTTPSSSSNVSGCLHLYLKNFKEGDKGAVFSKIEMAVSKGDHGIILLNSITNTLPQGGWGVVYRALFVKKSGDQWEAKGGVQWPDSLFMSGEASEARKIKFKLPESKNTEEIIWKNKICTLSRDCDTLLKDPKEEEKIYEWNSNSTGKNIYQGLEMVNLSDSINQGQESDFWNGKEEPLAANSHIVTGASPVLMGGQWKAVKKASAKGCCHSNYQPHPSIKAWFNLFKGDKGEWKEKTA